MDEEVDLFEDNEEVDLFDDEESEFEESPMPTSPIINETGFANQNVEVSPEMHCYFGVNVPFSEPLRIELYPFF